MGAADPSVDAEEGDPVGLGAEHAFSFFSQPQAEPREDLAVAERRRLREAAARLRFDKSHRAPTERRERSVEPRVAEEGCLLEMLRVDERRRWCARAGRDRLQGTPLGPREAVGRRRQLLEQSSHGRSKVRQLRRPTLCPLGERSRLGRSEGIPDRRRSGERIGCRRAPRRPQRLQLVRGELAQTVKGRLAGKRVNDNQFRRGTGLVRERERVDELQLVVEVMLEPEHHLQPVAQRFNELPITPLERGEDRAPTPPTTIGEESSPGAQQLRPRHLRHRPLVKHVLPGQHRAAERRLT